MKRPAESELVGEVRFGFGPPAPPGSASGNPFAGISLSAPGLSAGSPFTAAASGVVSNFAPIAAPAASLAALPGFGSNGNSANPFMGLSLFSQAASTETVGSLPAQPVPGARVLAREDSSDGQDATQPEDPVEEQGTPGAEGATGEEEDEVVFSAECKLWKMVRHVPPPPAAAGTGADDASGAAGEDGGATPRGGSAAVRVEEDNAWRWQERGTGIVHINKHAKTGAGRLVMRMRGVLKLLLNTPVFPTTKYEKVGQKSVRFVGVDAEKCAVPPKEGDMSLCAYRLNLLSNDQQGKFLAVLQDLLGVPAAA